jgi:phosphatidylglycerophosphate synthase
MNSQDRALQHRLSPVVAGLWGLQILYYVLLTLFYGLPLLRLFVFGAASTGYHVLLYAGLNRVRREFSLELSGEPVRRLNLPLTLSLLRLSSVPAVVFLFVSIRSLSLGLVVAPFLAAVFLTDLFDGYLARALQEESRIGRIVDAAGDYLLIFTLTALFVIYRLVPWWLAVLVFARLGLQSTGVVVLYLRKGYSSLKLTFLGKASVFSTFCLYGFEFAEHLGIPGIGSTELVTILEMIAALILGASLVDKVLFLRRELRHDSPDRHDPPARHGGGGQRDHREQP